MTNVSVPREVVEQVLPCPFCGEAKDLTVRVYGNGEDDAYVQCRECTTYGPDGGDREGAIAKWNQRAALAASTSPAPAVPDGPLPNEPKPCRMCDPSVGFFCEEHAVPDAAKPDPAEEFAHSKYASMAARDMALLDEIERLRGLLAAKPETQGERALSFETAAEAKADREHAEKYYRQAERLLTSNERTLHAEVERLNALLSAGPARVEPMTEQPDMFWNSDDAERQHYSIDEFLNEEICNGFIEVGAEFTIWQAKKLPSVKIRVTSIDEESCEAEYEVVEAAHGMGKDQS
jgi:Lar family restriction alleviation protein